MFICIIITNISAGVDEALVQVLVPDAEAVLHPVRIARFHVTRFSPRVGLPRNPLFCR